MVQHEQTGRLPADWSVQPWAVPLNSRNCAHGSVAGVEYPLAKVPHRKKRQLDKAAKLTFQESLSSSQPLLNNLHKLLPVVSASFVACGAETKSATQSDPQGWVDILPATDLKGWYHVPVPPNGKLGREQWHVGGEKRW